MWGVVLKEALVNGGRYPLHRASTRVFVSIFLGFRVYQYLVMKQGKAVAASRYPRMLVLDCGFSLLGRRVSRAGRYVRINERDTASMIPIVFIGSDYLFDRVARSTDLVGTAP